MLGGRVGLAIWGWSGGRRKRWRVADGVEVGPALWARSIEPALLLSPTWVRTPDHRRVTGIVPCARSPPSLHQITHVHVPNPWREEASGWRAIIARHVGKASEHTTYGPACSWGLEAEGASASRRHGMAVPPHRGGDQSTRRTPVDGTPQGGGSRSDRGASGRTSTPWWMGAVGKGERLTTEKLECTGRVYFTPTQDRANRQQRPFGAKAAPADKK